MVACLVSGIHSETEDFHQKLPAYSSLLGVNQPETNTNHTSQNGYFSVRNGKIIEISPTLNNVIEYLTDLYEKGHSYSSINVAKSSLSSLGISFESYTAGSHPLVVRFLKGVFNIRPPKSRYSSIWDVNVVLSYLRTLSPVKNISLKHLTLKIVMLMALTNAARVNTILYISY